MRHWVESLAVEKTLTEITNIHDSVCLSENAPVSPLWAHFIDMALVPSKHWEDKSVDQVEASGDDYQQRNASIGGGMGRGWEAGEAPTSHASISMWTGMPLLPLFKTLPWQTTAFMTKSEIFTMVSRPCLTYSHHNGTLPVLQFQWALLTWCFFRCGSFHLKCCHLANSCSFNRCWHKYSCFREDHPDLHLTPFVLNPTYNAFT